MKKIVCFGEVLWDIFENDKKIGGAPLNVALRLKSFNNEVYIISKLGNDDLGEQLTKYISKHGINPEFIQTDTKLKTGEVKVTLDATGSASYDILFPKAWDTISLTEQNTELVKSADAFIFGSLIARNSVSKKTLYQLIEQSKYKVFDLNLRAPYYSKKLLIDLMNKADFIKLNDDELFEVSRYVGSESESIEHNMTYLSEMTGTKSICVTKGKDGAVVLHEQQFYYNTGYSIKVADTVGAGDSFLATLIHHLLNGDDIQKAVDVACAVGALVAGYAGANPIVSQKEIDEFMKSY